MIDYYPMGTNLHPIISDPFSSTTEVSLVTILGGSVIWMAFRASFTSELSIRKLKLPFDDLESLSKSDYK